MPRYFGGHQEDRERRRDVRTVEGTVAEALPNAMFAVHLDDGTRVLGHIPGTHRGRYVRLVPGDRVVLELSPYDLSRGRIVERRR